MHERAVEVQRVGDDVAVEARDTESVEHEVLAGARVRDVADLGRLRVDQLREQHLRIRLRRARRRRRASARDSAALRAAFAATRGIGCVYAPLMYV